MKKIFTCISLAAATFMATTPVMAQQQKQLTDKEKDMLEDLYEAAVENYEKYLELSPNASDKADVEAQIKKIEEHQSTEKSPDKE